MSSGKDEEDEKKKKSSTKTKKRDLGLVKYSPLEPTQIGPFYVSAFTHIGKRNNQEDRFICCPNLYNGEYCFYGVFDGTVKEHASEFIRKNILNCLLTSKSFVKFDELTTEQKNDPSNRALLSEALTQCYEATDGKLLEWCRDKEIHYSATTSVTVLMHVPSRRMVCAHLGDSKIVLGQTLKPPSSTTEKSKKDQPMSRISGIALTIDHKPDQPDELKRIEAAGGSLTYLHGGKPFIRGGDFSQRKHAMQLNYSRAFGGKDLKMYGLSAVPDTSDLKINKHRDRVVILGSDGVWDVVDPDSAVKVVEQSRQSNLSPADELGRLALQSHDTKGSADNVSCIVAFFDFD